MSKRKWNIDIGPEELAKSRTVEQDVESALTEDFKKKNDRRPSIYERIEIAKRARRM